MSDEIAIRYWQDCMAEACDEANLTITPEQLKILAHSAEMGHECYGMSFYQPPSPLIDEVDRLKKKLRAEQEKIGCHACGGSGRLEYYAGPWWVNTGCDTCHGEGKVTP